MSYVTGQAVVWADKAHYESLLEVFMLQLVIHSLLCWLPSRVFHCLLGKPSKSLKGI